MRITGNALIIIVETSHGSCHLRAAVWDAFRDACRVFSASLAACWGDAARPWNGRALTDSERDGALRAGLDTLVDTGSPGLAAQAAHEWLSERAW